MAPCADGGGTARQPIEVVLRQLVVRWRRRLLRTLDRLVVELLVRSRAYLARETSLVLEIVLRFGSLVGPHIRVLAFLGLGSSFLCC